MGGPDIDGIDGVNARVRGSVAAVALAPGGLRCSPFRNRNCFRFRFCQFRFCCSRESVGAPFSATTGSRSDPSRPASPAGRAESAHTRWRCPDCSWSVLSAHSPQQCAQCPFAVEIDPQTGEIYGSFELVLPDDGACLGCGARGHAGGQCISCGAPIEPDDESFHYDFGWVDGPRPPPPPPEPPTPPSPQPATPPHSPRALA